MICRAWRLAFVVVVTLVMLASCSSAETPEQHPASSVPQRSGATADACVAPAGLALQDQDPSDHQVPWKRNGAGKVVITFETKNVTPDWVAEMQKGVAAWNRSPCLDTRLVQTCQPNRNCVTVSVAPESSWGQMVTSMQLSREVLPWEAISTIPAHLLAVPRQMLLFTKWGMLSALHTG